MRAFVPNYQLTTPASLADTLALLELKLPVISLVHHRALHGIGANATDKSFEALLQLSTRRHRNQNKAHERDQRQQSKGSARMNHEGLRL